MSHDIFKPSNLIGCLENKTADSAQTRKRAIVTRPCPSPERRSLGTRLKAGGSLQGTTGARAVMYIISRNIKWSGVDGHCSVLARMSLPTRRAGISLFSLGARPFSVVACAYAGEGSGTEL